MSYLFVLFIMPFIASLLVFIFPTTSPRVLKVLSLTLSLIPLGLLLSGHTAWIGMTSRYTWLPSLGIEFLLSVDSVSLVFLYLTAIIIPLSLFAANVNEIQSPRVFCGLVLLLQGLLIGFFTTRDLVIFTIFWEAMLLPLYFMINLWGGPSRQNAALKFLIYMIAGSALMIVAVLSLVTFTSSSETMTFNMDVLARFSTSSPMWIGAIFLLAFAVKTPLFPFHAWLPDAYCQASTAGTILLAALLSKAGIYGVFRIGMGLFPDLMLLANPLLLGLAIAGVFYGGLLAWMQNDFKRLLAYSSLAHVNFILAGLFIENEIAHTGALLQAFNHGVTIAALFLAAGWLEERLRSTSMGSVSGLTQFLPQLSWLTLVFVLSAIALPGTNNFIGELMILFGLFNIYPWLAAVLGLTVILSAVYMLRWMQKVYFEEPSFFQESWVDITKKEILLALPLIVLIFGIGIYPAPIIKQIAPIDIIKIAERR